MAVATPGFRPPQEAAECPDPPCGNLLCQERPGSGEKQPGRAWCQTGRDVRCGKRGRAKGTVRGG